MLRWLMAKLGYVPAGQDLKLVAKMLEAAKIGTVYELNELYNQCLLSDSTVFVFSPFGKLVNVYGKPPLDRDMFRRWLDDGGYGYDCEERTGSDGITTYRFEWDEMVFQFSENGSFMHLYNKRK